MKDVIVGEVEMRDEQPTAWEGLTEPAGKHERPTAACKTSLHLLHPLVVKVLPSRAARVVLRYRFTFTKVEKEQSACTSVGNKIVRASFCTN